MTKWNIALLAAALIGLVFSASSQTGAEYKEDRPDDQAPAAAGRPNQAGPGANATNMAALQGMDRTMKAMQNMHARMMAAKTPGERGALMPEHTKVMQDGMAMLRAMGHMQGMQGMGGMGGMRSVADASGDMGGRMQMLERRMDMMQSVMQMMMDRLSLTAGVRD